MEGIPTIDVTALRSGGDPGPVAAAIDAACREVGCFTIVGHGVPAELLDRLDHEARAFFALDEEEKATIAMTHGGRAWRGWFPVGGELTAGRPDRKEGLYFGIDLPPDDPRVVAGRPLHGPNLYPARPAGLRTAVAEYLTAVPALGQDVLRGMAAGLGLDPDWFRRTLTADPLVLFRIFRYPPATPDTWGVAEHTDYGLVTLLHQDRSAGLEVHGPDGWLAVPPTPDGFVVNLGDMLERMTGGRWRSTPHRVRNASDGDRLSFPLFLDPGWDVTVPMIPPSGDASDDVAPDRPDRARWDGRDVMAWTGTYGDYVLSKVARVFPDLGDTVL